MDTIINSFEIWTDAQGLKSKGRVKSIDNISLEGIARLREFILELAVRGKLVPQDPKDEPASALLKNIRKEKDGLVRRGKISKERILPEISEEDQTFELPQNWEWVRFNEITTYIQRGKGPKYANSGSVLVLSQKCVQWSGINLFEGKFIEDSSLTGYQFERFLQQDDLLWNSTGTGTVGRVAIVDNISETQLVADSHITVIRPLLANSCYLKAYISSNSIQQKIKPGVSNSLVSGSTNQVELNRSAVIFLPIPLPPLSEQNRIVAKVEELMALCDQLEVQQTNKLRTHQQLVITLLETVTQAKDAEEVQAAWQQLLPHFDTLFCTEDSIEQLKQTILQLAVMGRLVKQDPKEETAKELLKRIKKEKEKLVKEGKIKKESNLPEISEEAMLFKLPVNWQWTRLEKIAVVFSGASFRSEDFNETVGTKVIKISNAGVGEFIETNDYLPEDFLHKFKQYTVKENDLILALTRPYISTGLKISKCPASYNNSLLNQRVASIRPIEPNDYVYWYLRSSFVLGLFQKRFGNSGLQPNLKITDVTNLVLPIPPLAEQKRIISKINELFAFCDQLKNKITDSQEIQNTLSKTIVENTLS